MTLKTNALLESISGYAKTAAAPKHTRLSTEFPKTDTATKSAISAVQQKMTKVTQMKTGSIEKSTFEVIKKAMFNIVYYASKNIMLAGFIAIAVDNKFNLLASIVTLWSLILTSFLEVIRLKGKKNKKQTEA